MNLSYFLLAFLLSNTEPTNGQQLLRGKLPILEQETNFVAEEDGAQDTLSFSEGCEQVLVVVRHGKDGDHAPFPADIPNHIQDVKAEYYALNDVGHATAIFLRDHLDSFLDSNNYCAVTKAEVVKPGYGNTSNPLTTLSPWAAKHDVKYKYVANDGQNDDGAHSNNVGSSTSGTRLIVSTGKGLWATKPCKNCEYPRINKERVLAKMLSGSPDDFCFPSHGENLIYIYRGKQGDGAWGKVEQRIYYPATGKVSSTRYACYGADNKYNRTPV